MPNYPPLLQAQGVQATVTLLLEIDEAGQVTSAKVVKPAPQTEFNKAATSAALKQRWEPATRNGKPIPWRLPFTFEFRVVD